jgi:hypothetical protein
LKADRPETPASDSGSPESPLLDLPLASGDDLFAAAPPAPAGASAAPVLRRWRALAADLATVVLLVAAAALSATAVRGTALRPAALAWAAVFGLYLSFFAAVLPLTLFGRTLGMALADLTARPPGSPRIRSGEAIRRWVGTLATVATLGIPLLFTARDPESPTPADRLSGRPLVESGEPDRP